jgi:hypothetical protein
MDNRTKTCITCGKPFTLTIREGKRRQQSAMFCSPECYSAYRGEHAKTPARICPQCGKTHHKRTSLCATCYRKAPRQEFNPTSASMADGVDYSQSRICPVCGKTFYKKRTTSMADWNTKTTFCSRKCYGQSKLATSSTCAVCGKPFKPTGRNTRYCSYETCKHRSRRFCSPACKAAWYTGERNPNYMGGQARAYSSTHWKLRAQEIRERDKVCQQCGKPPADGDVLDVHHLIPWRVSHDESPENLIALCPSCHKAADEAWLVSNGHRKPLVGRRHQKLVTIV